jgi:hypothetical protein
MDDRIKSIPDSAFSGQDAIAHRSRSNLKTKNVVMNTEFLNDVDWMTVLPVLLGGGVFLGGMLMMFTGMWTARK